MTKKTKNENITLDLSLVLGYIAIKDLQNIEDRVHVLSRLGYGNAEIAIICEVTPGSVRTHKYSARKKTTKKTSIE